MDMLGLVIVDTDPPWNLDHLGIVVEGDRLPWTWRGILGLGILVFKAVFCFEKSCVGVTGGVHGFQQAVFGVAEWLGIVSFEDGRCEGGDGIV